MQGDKSKRKGVSIKECGLTVATWYREKPFDQSVTSVRSQQSLLKAIIIINFVALHPSEIFPASLKSHDVYHRCLFTCHVHCVFRRVSKVLALLTLKVEFQAYFVIKRWHFFHIALYRSTGLNFYMCNPQNQLKKIYPFVRKLHGQFLNCSV